MTRQMLRQSLCVLALWTAACCLPSTRDEARIYGAFVDQVGLSPQGSYPTANRTSFLAHFDKAKLATDLTDRGLPAAVAMELSTSIGQRNHVYACPHFPVPSSKGIYLQPVGARPAMDRAVDLWNEGWLGPEYEHVFLSFSRVGFTRTGGHALLYTGDRYHGAFWLLLTTGTEWTLDPRPIPSG